MLAVFEKKMAIAVALVRAVPGQEKSVYHAIKGCKGVRRIHHIFGDHDFFMMVEAESISMLAQHMAEINKIENISSIDTVLIGNEGFLEEGRSPAALA